MLINFQPRDKNYRYYNTIKFDIQNYTSKDCGMLLDLENKTIASCKNFIILKM